MPNLDKKVVDSSTSTCIKRKINDDVKKDSKTNQSKEDNYKNNGIGNSD